ncbi:hypothetical protein PHMEG_00031634, partial [Phytophthora megakarya]
MFNLRNDATPTSRDSRISSGKILTRRSNGVPDCADADNDNGKEILVPRDYYNTTYIDVDPAGSWMPKKPAKAPAKNRPPKKAPTKSKKAQQWLLIPANYKINVGESTASKTVAHGMGITKVEGFKRMAVQVTTSSIRSSPQQLKPQSSEIASKQRDLKITNNKGARTTHQGNPT